MKLKFWRFDLHLRHVWRIASGTGQGITFFPVVFVALSDSQGRQGLGEAAPSSRYAENIDTVQAFLQQIDPFELSFDDLAKSTAYLENLAPGQRAAKTAVQLALVDAAAQQSRQPLYDFLELGFTERRHVTSFSIGLDQPEIIQSKVVEANPFPILKLKVGGSNDARNLAALRTAAPDKRIRVDANEGWKTKEEALRQIEWLHRDGQIEFVEQPMPASTSRADLAWLKQRSPLPLFADESYLQGADIDLAQECFHGVNVKLVKTGGILGAREALQTARNAGLKTMIGCMIESSVLITAAAHLAELADYLDLDGNLLVNNDPYAGVRTEKGMLSFAEIKAEERFGLGVIPQPAETHSFVK